MKGFDIQIFFFRITDKLISLEFFCLYFQFEKLVKFFTHETIYVAEMEVNAEMLHKVRLQ